LPDAGLVVEHLTVRFGGVIAVNGVSLSAPLGHVTALIGPNGAGKTTTFNACTGLLRPTSGRVVLAGHDVTTAPPQHHARLGLGRTFQRMQLCESLPVFENVALGRESLLSGNRPWRHLRASRPEHREITVAAEQAIEACGLTTLARRDVASLSTGQKRLVELARVAAGGFSLLLLDEPSSGLDRIETSEFGRILVGLIAARGVGVLLVEHDMSLVMSISSRIHVLDFGQLIFAGSPADAQSSDVVRAAYLGVTP
jgi:ABC-type branched-subunit amino acid transport system ATPase component